MHLKAELVLLLCGGQLLANSNHRDDVSTYIVNILKKCLLVLLKTLLLRIFMLELPKSMVKTYEICLSLHQ